MLVDGEYQPMEIVHEPDGLIWGHSAVLGLDLCWAAGDLRFRDPAGGEFLLTPREQRVGRQELQSQWRFSSVNARLSASGAIARATLIASLWSSSAAGPPHPSHIVTWMPSGFCPDATR